MTEEEERLYDWELEMREEDRESSRRYEWKGEFNDYGRFAEW